MIEKINSSLFKGKISGLQIKGINDISEAFNAEGLTDKRQLAYILATVYHESGRRMQPVKEFGGESYLKAKPYYPYYGRDLVQTTWKGNYQKVKDFSGIDVVNKPELIGQMPLAAKVAVHFMNKGYYTGKKLSDYFNEGKEDPINARKIINGLDRANTIAAYYKLFLDAIKETGEAPPTPV